MPKIQSKEFQLCKFRDKLPEEFKAAKLLPMWKEYPDVLHMAKDYVAKYPISSPPRGLYLWSRMSGVGKTALAVGITHSLIRRHKTKYVSFFVDASELFERLRSYYCNNIVLKDTQLYADYMRADMIIIDDLGIAKLSYFAAQKYYELLNGLWSERKHVIVTSKFPIVKLLNRAEPDVDVELLDSIMSRFSGMVEEFHLSGRDKR